MNYLDAVIYPQSKNIPNSKSWKLVKTNELKKLNDKGFEELYTEHQLLLNKKADNTTVNKFYYYYNS